MKKFIPMILLLAITSCGKSDGGSDSQVGNAIEKEEAMEDGKYVAFLRPLNSSVNGFIPFGRAELSLKEDELSVSTFLDDDQRVLHVQNIYAGSRCPNISDDTNKDGFVDIQEATKALGPIILPLDNDLTSRKEGEGVYPTGPSFTYSKKASWSGILRDLKEAYEDHFVLKGDQISLKDKVIVVQGTSASGNLPESIATLGNLETHQSIPISCGVIRPI